jgi:hypothetical protein
MNKIGRKIFLAAIFSSAIRTEFESTTGSSELIYQNIAARNPWLSGHLRPQMVCAVGFG